MTRWFAAMVVCSMAAAAMGQSLGEVAKKERQRRKRNERKGVPVRSVTESDMKAYAPKESQPAAEGEQSATEEDVSSAIQKALGDGPAPSAAPGAATSPAPTSKPGRLKTLGPAPAFRLEDRRGKTYSLRDFRGRVLLLDFWATWCGPCRATMPEVEKLYKEYRNRGLEVVGINIEGRSDQVLSFIDQSGYSFLVLFDSGNWNAPVAKQYNVTSIPRTFLIDKDGNIVFSGHPNRLQESLIEAALQ